MAKKFWAVRAVAWLQIAVGAIVILGAVFALVRAFGVLPDWLTDPETTGTFGVWIAVGIFIVGLFVMAQGQILQVFLQIEENTRPHLEQGGQ